MDTLNVAIQKIRGNMGNLGQYIRHKMYESALSELSVLSLRMAVLSDRLGTSATIAQPDALALLDGLEGYTPGPWTYFVGNANGRGLIRVETACEAPVAGVHICSLTRTPENERNANAIYRLPELIDALRQNSRSDSGRPSAKDYEDAIAEGAHIRQNRIFDADLLQKLRPMDIVLAAFDSITQRAEQLRIERLSNPGPNSTDCKHEWVIADNSIVKNASMCLKCHAIKPTIDSRPSQQSTTKEGET